MKNLLLSTGIQFPFKKEFHELLEYRILRAQNEPIDDIEWFMECAEKEFYELIEKYFNSI